jgi:hypothetical protein
VNKASQTIAFSAIPDKTVTDAPFGATATSTSSLTVSFATISDKVTISGSQITLAKPGRVSVTASQAGNLSFIPATNVVQSFCIKPVKPTVTVTGAATATATLTSSATSGNQWYFNGSPIAAATGQTLNAMLGGIYKVQVSADDCLSDFSADQVVVITGDLSKEFRSDVIVYPNPARTLLVVSLPDVLERKIVSVYHSDGREVDHAETQGREISFQVSGYSRGLYLIKVITDKSYQTARFVKE